ncbi:FimV family protein [Piscinibacter sakaiensis]|uniref:type IV pilus assembly protein FimV n=1 Tax=Piscinibacter sakaiensis TaxID=1547922 RepID=UPI003AAB04B3
MRRPATAVTVGLMLLLVSASVFALGMGRVRTASFLGDPLDFTVALLAQPGDPVVPECISADVYSGESRVPDDLVRISIDRARDGAPSSLRVVTATRIDEPLARVDLRLECGTSIRRSYVVFIDPPTLDLARTERFAAADGLQPQLPARRAAEPSTAATPARAASRRASTASGRAPSSARSSGGGASRAARPQRSAAAAPPRRASTRDTRVAAVPREAPATSSLKLESAPPVLPGADTAGGAARSAAGGSATADPTLAAASAAPAAAASPTASGVVVGVAPSASAAVSGLLGELAAKADADAMLVSADKLRALDENLARLRSDNEALQRSSAELQQRLLAAEQDRSSNTLIYGLAAAMLLLLLAVIALLVRQSAMRRESDWLKAAAENSPPVDPTIGAVRSIVRPSAAAGSHAAADAAAAAAAARLSEKATTPGPRAALHPGAGKSAAPVVGGAAAAAAGAAGLAAADDDDDDASAAPAPAAARAFDTTAVHEPRQDVSVDELIDLEQQADFFEVLGQDDAAVDLLNGHLQGTGGVSPMPYLKLLEIHRRRGERAAYDRVRERFNRRFGAFAPEWEAHSGHDRGLQDYPQIVEQLQRGWDSPTHAMNTLTDLLFKRHEGAETFDLPAYAELLFLYSIARDLAETEASSSDVDLLLPLDDGDADRSFSLDAADGSPDTLPVDPSADLADLPPTVPESRPDAAAPEPAPPAPAPGERSLPDLDFDLPDLDLHEPKEPKGPLSKN